MSTFGSSGLVVAMTSSGLVSSGLVCWLRLRSVELVVIFSKFAGFVCWVVSVDDSNSLI